MFTVQCLIFSYAPKFVKEYVEEAKPIFSVGEYWDTCNYCPPDYRLDSNQGINLVINIYSRIVICSYLLAKLNKKSFTVWHYDGFFDDIVYFMCTYLVYVKVLDLI